MEATIRKIIAAEVKKQLLAVLKDTLSKKQAVRRKAVKACKIAKPETDEKEWKFRDILNLRLVSGLNNRQFTDAIGVSPVIYYYWKKQDGVISLSERVTTALDNLLQEVGNN